jgi:endonuclease V-like protein UPF0215 family
MSTPRLREIKKEIRVLGLASWSNSSTGTHEAVGVLLRGKYWLDGVLRTHSSAQDVTEEVVEMITNSNHHPQIRVILLHSELLTDGSQIDPYRLSEGTKRPVIAMGFEDPLQETEGEGDHTHLAASSATTIGINDETAKRVLRASTRTEKYPEALRVAELLNDSFRRN